MASHPFSLEKNRGLYLGFFFLSNWLIAYSALPLGFKLTLGLFGILLPLYVAVRTSAFPRSSERPDPDLKLDLPLGLLLAGLALALFLRFHKLTTLFCWPTLDEGWNGILALELSKDWNWRFFYTFGDAPPLPVWCGALLFKLGASSPIALWLPSAIVSCLTVVVGYFAARQFFSRSFALICGGLLAFSHWPLFIGRFCHQGIWLPLWICGFFYLWGRFQSSKENKARRAWAAIAGAGLGLGSFTFTPWLGAAGLLFLWAFWTLWLRSKKTRPEFLIFTGGFVLALLPFLLAVLKEGYGHHIRSLSPWGGTFHEFQFLTNFFKYFAVLVWGAYEKDPAYTPVWGGFLNPLLGAFFFLGVGEMIRRWRLGLVRWVGAFFLLFLAPGALSPNLETFRVAQVMPLLLVITAFGIHPFMASFSNARRVWAWVGVLAFTGAFDFDQLAKPYRDPVAHPQDFGRPLRSMERYRIAKALEGLGKDGIERIGPLDFGTDSINDPTLSVMLFPSSGSIRPRPVPSLTMTSNVHYGPFLKKRFPGADWTWVGKDLPVENGGRLLGSIPGTPENQRTLHAWRDLWTSFLNADLARFAQNSGPLVRPVSILAAAYPQVKGDPFLESVYWDKMAAYAYEDANYEVQLKCYQNAVTRGYPTADLYFKLGQMYLVGKKVKEAKEAFIRATKAPMDRTQATQVLEWMAAQEASVRPRAGGTR